MGRLSPDAIGQIRKLAAAGHSKRSAMRMLGHDWRTTVRHWPEAPPVAGAGPGESPAPIDPDAALAPILPKLAKSPLSLDEIAAAAGLSRGAALDALDAARAGGLNLFEIGGKWSVEKRPQIARDAGRVVEYVSRPDNTFLFGALGDSHLCSKYERLDVLESLYDAYAEEGVDRVFHAGNWIDGEAPFNRFDLHTHGMDAQLDYLARAYPRRDGIDTYAVAGDDHEGWYSQRNGVDIGRRAVHTMRDAGRDDWHDLGYMECFVRLVNANTGASAMLAVVHPGGGSAYALSYTVQKIVESYEGGGKPAVGLYGHYHKMEAANIRNVWTLQTGTQQDQTPFMRKKRLEAHVGGAIVRLTQDPSTGAIVRFAPELLRYFDRGYYENDRWSHARPVVLPARGA